MFDGVFNEPPTFLIILTRPFRSSNGLACELGSVQVDARWVTGTEIECVAAAREAGTAFVVGVRQEISWPTVFSKTLFGVSF